MSPASKFKGGPAACWVFYTLRGSASVGIFTISDTTDWSACPSEVPECPTVRNKRKSIFRFKKVHKSSDFKNSFSNRKL